MTTALILLLVAAVTLIGLAVANVIKNDGYGHPSVGRTPPRSHVPDTFDPVRMA